MSISLHKEHGLNLTIAVCFWCRESKDTLVLLGSAYKGKAPLYMTLDYEPCKACLKSFSSGILIFEASKEPVVEGQPPMDTLYPTRRHVVAAEQFIVNNADNFGGEEVVEKILSAGKVALDHLLFQHLIDAVAPEQSEEASDEDS